MVGVVWAELCYQIVFEGIVDERDSTCDMACTQARQAHPQDGFLALETGLREVALIARLTEDLLVFKHKRGILESPVA